MKKTTIRTKIVNFYFVHEKIMDRILGLSFYLFCAFLGMVAFVFFFDVHSPTEECYRLYQDKILELKNAISYGDEFVAPSGTTIQISEDATITFTNTYSCYSVSASPSDSFSSFRKNDGNVSRLITIIVFGGIIMGLGVLLIFVGLFGLIAKLCDLSEKDREVLGHDIDH